MQGNMMKSRPVLDPKKRREIITRIGDILEFQCRKCPYCFKNPEAYCQDCQYYKELRRLGDQLLDQPFPKRKEKESE